MKNEKIIEAVTHFKSLLNVTEKEQFKAAFEMFTADGVTPEKISGGTAAHFLAALEVAARSELSAETAKKAGRGAVKKALEKMLKTGAAHYPHQTYLKKAATVDGCQLVCDGVRIFRLYNAVELSPEYVSSDENNAEKLQDLYLKIVNGSKENKTELLTVPAASELDALIKAGKAEKRAAKDRTPVLYDFGDGLPAVNAEYLRDVLTVYGEGIEISAGVSPLSPLYFSGDAGDGIICPVRKAARATA